jgi:hypothetical protein
MCAVPCAEKGIGRVNKQVFHAVILAYYVRNVKRFWFIVRRQGWESLAQKHDNVVLDLWYL